MKGGEISLSSVVEAIALLRYIPDMLMKVDSYHSFGIIPFMLIYALVISFLFFRPTVHLNPYVPAEKPVDQLHEPASTRLPGIDVSHYQGKVVWPLVQEAGVRYVYLKATDGITYKDPKYEENLEALKALDLSFGAYHFFHPKDDPVEQARHFLSVAAIGQGSLPPVLDIEVTHIHTPDKIQSAVKKWLDYVEERTGCRPIIYTFGAFWDHNLGNEFLTYPLWLAEYADKPLLPKGVRQWLFWQHSEKGNVAGIKGYVDLNWFDGNKRALEQIKCKG